MRTTTPTTKANNAMLFSSNISAGGQATEIGAVRQHLAEAMIGKTVDVLNGRAVTHGTVSGVFQLSGIPKLLVNGRMYDMSQVLTAIPS
jgi:hypothetical protein